MEIPVLEGSRIVSYRAGFRDQRPAVVFDLSWLPAAVSPTLEAMNERLVEIGTLTPARRDFLEGRPDASPSALYIQARMLVDEGVMTAESAKRWLEMNGCPL